MNDDKLCPITKSPCMKTKCAWFIVEGSNEDDFPWVFDDCDCAITKEYFMLDQLGYEVDELTKAVTDIRRILNEQERR